MRILENLGCLFLIVGYYLYFQRRGYKAGKERGYKDGYSKGWSDCECWWIEQDAETQKAREAMWRKL